jgi:hypothetical protein
MVNNSTNINQTMNHLSPLTSAQWTYRIWLSNAAFQWTKQKKNLRHIIGPGFPTSYVEVILYVHWAEVRGERWFIVWLILVANKTHNTPLEHDPWRMQHLMHVKTTFIISYKQLCMQWVLVTRPESMTTWPYVCFCNYWNMRCICWLSHIYLVTYSEKLTGKNNISSKLLLNCSNYVINMVVLWAEA